MSNSFQKSNSKEMRCVINKRYFFDAVWFLHDSDILVANFCFLLYVFVFRCIDTVTKLLSFPNY